MDLSGDIWDLNDILAKLQVEADKAEDDYGENLVRAIQSVERAVGFLEEAERTQPKSQKLKAVK